MKKSIPVKMGKTYTMKIDGITGTGEGVASVDGFKVFVDKAVPGDSVEAKIKEIKKNYAKADLSKILEPSGVRREHSICPYSENCGGCPYILIDYKNQLQIKQDAVEDALVRKSGLKDIDILPIIGGDEYNYRNKAQFKVDENGVGFYKKKSHDLIHLETCKLQDEAINRVIPLLEKMITESGVSIYDEKTHRGVLRGIVLRSNERHEVMVIFVVNASGLGSLENVLDILESDPNVVSIYANINRDRGNRVMGEKSVKVFERRPFYSQIGDVDFILSPSSFFQVNASQTKVLYDVVKDYADLSEGELVYDLYCGTGTIGLYLTATSGVHNRLIGVETNKDAIRDAVRNAEINNVKNAEFYSGRAEIITKNLDQKPDCVILDPPRKGCEKSLLELLLEIRAERIVYVSCNPTTLARDLLILKESYNIEKVQPVDLFPQTGHVECVALLRLNNNRNSGEKDDERRTEEAS